MTMPTPERTPDNSPQMDVARTHVGHADIFVSFCLPKVNPDCHYAGMKVAGETGRKATGQEKNSVVVHSAMKDPVGDPHQYPPGVYSAAADLLRQTANQLDVVEMFLQQRRDETTPN